MPSAAVSSFKSAIVRIRRESKTSEHYEPPPGPPPSHSTQGPPNHSPYVHEVDLPLIEPHRSYNLAAQGWTTLTLSPSTDPRASALRTATSNLFTTAQTFFAREESYKRQYLSTNKGSEEGYNSIPGEKEFFTIRSTALLPPELGDAAEAYWTVAGDLLHETLGKIAESVELKPEALARLAKGCIRLQEARSATMLRVFRYEGWEAKVTAEAHADLGLLSLVSGLSPGLEVWNALRGEYHPVEKEAKDMSSMASLLVGRQLQRLTNGVYAPGGHLVRAYPAGSKEENGKRYRFSIVFVLRAHYPEVLYKESLTSGITGQPTLIDDGMTCKELFLSIKGAHYNINTGLQDREEQKKRLQASIQGRG